MSKNPIAITTTADLMVPEWVGHRLADGTKSLRLNHLQPHAASIGGIGGTPGPKGGGRGPRRGRHSVNHRRGGGCRALERAYGALAIRSERDAWSMERARCRLRSGTSTWSMEAHSGFPAAFDGSERGGTKWLGVAGTRPRIWATRWLD